MTGEGRKLPGAVVTLATAGGSGGGRGGGDCWRRFPSFSPVSSVSLLNPLSSVFFHCLLFFSSVSSGLSAAVRWCAVAVERKHGGSCGCSSSLVFFFFLCHFLFFPASLRASLSLFFFVAQGGGDGEE